MNYPSWDKFNSINAGDKCAAFENLARILFRERYELSQSLPYFKNHPGNETDIIQQGNEWIGFQAKYFDNGIDAAQVIKSMEKARAFNPKQTKLIIYTNGDFGIPRGGKQYTVSQQNIIDEAKKLNLQLEWMFGQNILDVVAKSELAYNLFFNPDSQLIHLEDHIHSANESLLRTVKTTITRGGKDVLSISRDGELKELASLLTENNAVIIEGEGGVGKSALIKQYFTNHPEHVVLCFTADQFDTQDVNSLFHYECSYQLSQVNLYFDGAEQKYIFIDSAEALSTLPHKRAYSLFMDAMSHHGWTFIFTVRPYAAFNLKQQLDEFELSYQSIILQSLGDDALNSFLNDNNLTRPTSKHLSLCLHNLFYLAQYAELTGYTPSSLKDFRNKLWALKIKGEKTCTEVEQEAREQCFLRMVQRKVETNSYHIQKEGLDATGLALLRRDEIISDREAGLCIINHDIYQDWAMDYLTHRAWMMANGDVDAFMTRQGDMVTSINSFKRWFSEEIDAEDDLVKAFIDKVFQNATKEPWTAAILSAVLDSEKYANWMFDTYQRKLAEDDYRWFVKLLRILLVNNQVVQSYYKTEGEQYPQMVPVGAGWKNTIRYLSTHYEEIQEIPSNLFHNVLWAFASYKEADGELYHQAGLLALKPYLLMAAKRQNSETVFFADKKKSGSLLSLYLNVIHNEISDIIRLVVGKGWATHLDPYYEICEILLTLKDWRGYNLYVFHPQEMLSLLNFFWELKKKSSEEKLEEAWNLDEQAIHLKYFPAAARQTCLPYLLNAHPDITARFIVDFVNRCTKQYAKSKWLNDSMCIIPFQRPDGSCKDLYYNQTLWNLYRGTASLATPYLMQSIHMALEDYLLRMMEANHDEDVKRVLDILLNDTISASLVSVVASLSTAYPLRLWSYMIKVCSEIRFLRLDSLRHSAEFSSNSIDFAYADKKELLEERRKSNGLRHRQLDLVDLLVRLQIQFNNTAEVSSQSRLKELYAVVDSLKQQFEELNMDPLSDLAYLVTRCDARTMKQETVRVGDKIAIQYTPTFSEEQERHKEKVEKESTDFLSRLELSLWADLRMRGECDKTAQYVYDREPLKALEQAEQLLTQLKDKSQKNNLLPLDDYIPSKVCAVLLKDYTSALSDDSFNRCAQIVLEALEDIPLMMDLGAMEYPNHLNVLPLIIGHGEVYKERCKQIVLSYVEIFNRVGSQCPCDTIADMLVQYKLWEKEPNFMREVWTEAIASRVQDRNDLSMDETHLLLCLAPEYLSLSEVGPLIEASLEKLSHIWDANDRKQSRYLGYQLMLSQPIARFILSCPSSKKPLYLSYFQRYLNTNHSDNLLCSFIIQCIITNRYDDFREVWEIIYDTVISANKYNGYGEMFNSYMLCPNFYVSGIRESFKFEKKDIQLFKRIIEDKGFSPYVWRNLLNVSLSIGKQYPLDFIPLLDKLATEYEGVNLSPDGMSKLEALIGHVYSTAHDEIRNDVRLRQQVLHILEYMEKHGSSYAANLKSEF